MFVKSVVLFSCWYKVMRATFSGTAPIVNTEIFGYCEQEVFSLGALSKAKQVSKNQQYLDKGIDLMDGLFLGGQGGASAVVQTAKRCYAATGLLLLASCYWPFAAGLLPLYLSA